MQEDSWKPYWRVIHFSVLHFAQIALCLSLIRVQFFCFSEIVWILSNRIRGFSFCSFWSVKWGIFRMDDHFFSKGCEILNQSIFKGLKQYCEVLFILQAAFYILGWIWDSIISYGYCLWRTFYRQRLCDGKIVFWWLGHDLFLTLTIFLLNQILNNFSV